MPLQKKKVKTKCFNFFLNHEEKKYRKDNIVRYYIRKVMNKINI